VPTKMLPLVQHPHQQAAEEDRRPRRYTPYASPHLPRLVEDNGCFNQRLRFDAADTPLCHVYRVCLPGELTADGLQRKPMGDFGLGQLWSSGYWLVNHTSRHASHVIDEAIATGSRPNAPYRHAFIHATKNPDQLNKWEAPGTTSVRIDLRKLNGLFGDLLYGLDIFDLSSAQLCEAWGVGVRDTEMSQRARNYAIFDAEVLLVPNVPRDAIEVMHHN